MRSWARAPGTHQQLRLLPALVRALAYLRQTRLRTRWHRATAHAVQLVHRCRQRPPGTALAGRAPPFHQTPQGMAFGKQALHPACLVCPLCCHSWLQRHNHCPGRRPKIRRWSCPRRVLARRGNLVASYNLRSLGHSAADAPPHCSERWKTTAVQLQHRSRPVCCQVSSGWPPQAAHQNPHTSACHSAPRMALVPPAQRCLGSHSARAATTGSSAHPRVPDSPHQRPYRQWSGWTQGPAAPTAFA